MEHSKANRRSKAAARAGVALSLLLAAGQLGFQHALAQGTPLNAPDPHQLAADAAQNEIRLIHYEQDYVRYLVHTRDAKGERVREVIESKDGTVARILEKDGHPISADEDEAERQRLQAMLDSPSDFAKHIEKDQTGKQLAVNLISLLPDAMIFRYVPDQPQRAEKPPGAPREYVIDFKPNPKWSPPTMTSQVLTGLEGRCWIDPKTHYLTRMETHVFQAVNFGFGIFAHIYPGGHFTVEQQPIGNDRWMVNHFVQHLTVRVVVKTVKQDSDLQAYEFLTIPKMDYKAAIHLLLERPLPSSGDSRGDSRSSH